MRVDAEPELPAEDGEERLPPRARSFVAAEARERMLARVVAGGVAPGRTGDVSDSGTIAGYRLLRRLGRGGMGEVWAAVREDDDAPVAIKLLRTAALVHEPTRKRFMREARTAASVRHPGIVRIFDVGSTDVGTPYIVMEQLEGRPLEAVLREHGALPWPAAREILVQVAEALAFAHSRGVIHRDLKPANVMVAGELEAPRCTIIDFGLARREVIASGSESLSHTGEVFGSPPFMSPEQFRGDDVDARSDVYGFGCTMYCVLTGQRPFAGEKLGELMYQHLFRAAPEPEGMQCPAQLRPALASIVLRALRKAPEHRFATMAELASALRRVDDDPSPVPLPHEDPIASVAAPPAAASRTSRPWPWILAGVAATVGLVVALRGAGDPTVDAGPRPHTEAGDRSRVVGEGPGARAGASAAGEDAGARARAAVAGENAGDHARAAPVDESDAPPQAFDGSSRAESPPSVPAEPDAVPHTRDSAAKIAPRPRARPRARAPEPAPPHGDPTDTPAPASDASERPASELPPNPFRSARADGAQ